MLHASNTGGQQFPIIEAGLHEAVCYAVVDIGTVHSEMYGNDQRKIVLIWEVPDSRIDLPDKGNLPRALSKHYTMSLSQKANLRKDLVSWRTKDFTPDEEKSFDVSKLAGASCLLNIVHKVKVTDGTQYASIGNVLPLKGKKLKNENPLVVYGIEENGAEIPAGIPDWLKAEIMESPEYQNIWHPQSVLPTDTGGDSLEPESEETDLIPF